MEGTLGDYRIRFLGIIMFSVLTAMGLIFSVYLLLNAQSVYTYAIAILFFCLSAVSGVFNIASSYWYYRSFFYDTYIDGITKSLKPLSKLPTVAIAMPTFNEDPDIVIKNMMILKGMKYPGRKAHYYLLDDSTEAPIQSRLSNFSRKNGITYLHRNNREGYKAGALNNMLKHSDDEFVAVFDYDETLTDKNFLMETLPYFGDKSVSYVQTEKRYAKGTLFSDTVDLFDAFFFKFIQPARALNNTAIFAGSCGIIRRSAIDSIGGFPEYIIEDTFFSFESDINKYKSLYVPKVYALGKPIKTFSELAKQQWRYNYGDTQFLKYFFTRKKNDNKKLLSPLSQIDYMTHGFGLNYLSTVLLLFTLISVFIVFSTFPVSHITLENLFATNNLNIYLEIFGVSALLVSILTPVILTKLYFKSAKKGFMIFIVNFALVLIRTKAAISAIFSINPRTRWVRINARDGRSITHAMRNSLAEVSFSAFLVALGAIAIFIDNFSGGIWLLWYGLLYSSTFFFFYKYG